MTNELTPTLPPLALALTPYSPVEPFKQKQTLELWEIWQLTATRVFHFQICFTQRLDEFDSKFGCVSPLEILFNS